MSKFDIYDENVRVTVLRDQTPYVVPFCEIKDGDVVCDKDDNPWFTAAEDAHESGDADYEGWLVGDDSENYFPEDFGAKLISSKDEPDETIQVSVIRGSAEKVQLVSFEDIKEGDKVFRNDHLMFTADTDAFYIDDDPDHYGEYGVQDEEGNTYYPGDFKEE